MPYNENEVLIRNEGPAGPQGSKNLHISSSAAALDGRHARTSPLSYFEVPSEANTAVLTPFNEKAAFSSPAGNNSSSFVKLNADSFEICQGLIFISMIILLSPVIFANGSGKVIPPAKHYPSACSPCTRGRLSRSAQHQQQR
jgi:hypothetical protein